jgi:hypothetical protein
LIPGYPSNNITSIGSVSQYTNEWSPIKNGDILFFGSFPTTQQESVSLIGEFPYQTGEEITQNFRDYYDVSNNVALDVLNVNFPYSQSIEITGYRDKVRYSFYNEEGNFITSAPSPYGEATWQMWSSSSNFSYMPGIINNFSPNQTTLSTFQSSSFAQIVKGNFTLCCDDEYYQDSILSGLFQLCTPESVHTMIINKSSVDQIDRSSFIETLSHGDIIEFSFSTQAIGDDLNAFINPTYAPSRNRYKILQKPFHPTVNGSPFTDAFIIRIQYIPSDSSMYFINDKPTGIQYSYLAGGFNKIHKIIKFRAPYIDTKISSIFSNLPKLKRFKFY